MKGYKVFNKDLIYKGVQYEIGQTYEIPPHEQRFYFCKNIMDLYTYGDLLLINARLCEIEILGEVHSRDEYGFYTDKFKIIRELDYTKFNPNNTGDFNIGNNNTGDLNLGNWNSGRFNLGNGNTGCSNLGDLNTGDFNIGDWNCGDFNTGNWNTGVFNTDEDPKIKMFDKDSDWHISTWIHSKARRILNSCLQIQAIFIDISDMSEEEKENHPEYIAIGGYLKIYPSSKEDKQKWWDNLSEESKQECYKLPNFDADKFIKCLGIEHL